jgi:hypothetical protein
MCTIKHIVEETGKMQILSALSMGLAACTCMLTAAPAQAALAPAGSSYQLTVTTSFEPSFKDCWTFTGNGRAIISHGGGLGGFPYQLTGLNTQAGHFQAAWRGNIGIGFSGVTSGTSITGDAVDTRTRTYSFSGTQVKSCGNAQQELHGFQLK